MPLTRFLKVINLFKKATFSQIKNIHGNTIHVFTYTDDFFVTKCDNSQRSFYKNPLRDSCELIYLLTKIITDCMCKAMDFITVKVFYLVKIAL